MKNKKQFTAPIKKNVASTKLPYLHLGLVGICLVLITYFAFTPALEGQFTNWDDDTYVTNNTMVKSKSTPWEEIFTVPVALNYHPVTMLSLAWNYQSGGLTPRAYHTTNVFLHLLNVHLIFLFFYFLSGKKIVTGAVAGVLFGIHPLHVESVAWISERKDVLYVMFFTAAMLCYLRYRASSKIGWLICCFLLFVLSCLSKAMAVVLPVALLLVDYFQDRKLSRAVLLEKIPFFILSLIFGIAALRIQANSSIEPVQSFTLWQRLLFGSYGYVIYLIKFLIPVQLSGFYPYPVSNVTQPLPFHFYLSPVFILAGIFGLYRFARKDRVIIFGWLFFTVTIILVLQFISVGNALMADRYSYLSYAGLSFIASYYTDKLWWQRKALRSVIAVTGGAVIICFSLLTYNRTKTWYNSETLWTDVITKYPSTATAYKNRGNYYGQSGNYQAALRDYEVLLNMNTTDAEVYNNLGNIYADQNKVQESITAYSKAIELKPDYTNAFINRAISYNATGQAEKAIEDFSKALSLKPSANTFAQRGFSYYNTGKFREAVNDFSSALELQHDFAGAWYYRGLSNQRLSNTAAAVEDLGKARSLGFEGDYSILNKP